MGLGIHETKKKKKKKKKRGLKLCTILIYTTKKQITQWYDDLGKPMILSSFKVKTREGFNLNNPQGNNSLIK